MLGEVGVSLAALTDAVLAQLKYAFLNPIMLGVLLMDELKAQDAATLALAQERRDIAAQIAGIDTELARLVEAVASGLAPAAIVDAIRTREDTRAAAQAKLEHLDELAAEAAEPFDVVAWAEETRELLDDVRSTLEADPAAGRQMLRHVLVGPTTVTPKVDDGGRRVYGFTGKAGYAGLVDPAGRQFSAYVGEGQASGAATVRRVEHVVAGQVQGGGRPVPAQRECPRGDSNTRHAV